MAGLPDPSSPDVSLAEAVFHKTTYWPTFREKRSDAYAKSTGVVSQPGRVINKDERRRRKQASIDNLDGFDE
ncbi:hypothetical protein LTR53_020588, partial [Teratosphaeriaceae sp. CCFEE 6253]